MGSKSSIISSLPEVRGKLRENAELAKVNWFQVGGTAEVLFRPEDTDDLKYFIAKKPSNIAITVLGVGSNLLVRDGGIDGVVVRLGRGFTECRAEGSRIIVGAGCLNSNMVLVAKEHGIGGLEFLSGVPGSIGGALMMNAGAYGTETKDMLIEAEAIDTQGNIHVLTPENLGYSYRKSKLPEGWIFTKATLQGKPESIAVISSIIEEISNKRNATQPVRTRTGGSTFKNPEGHKAWQLIDNAGCRGLKVGGAQVSELHCNFLINLGDATANDLETLGETVRSQVFDHSGIMLEWEIKIIGKTLTVDKKNDDA